MYPSKNHLPLVGIIIILFGACTFEIEPGDSQWQGPDQVGVNTSTVTTPQTGEQPKVVVPPIWTEEVLEPAVSIVAGANHACALSANGDVSCWGKNDVGQLGYGHMETIGDDEPAASHGIVDVGDLVISLAAGQEHTCAILEKGSIRCWGFGGDLALGNGNGKYYTVGDDEHPGEMGDAIIYSNSPFAQVVAGDHHSCMRTEAGSIKCWGNSPQGALGYGFATQTGGWLGNVPIGGDASFLVAGAEHTCAVVDGGMVRCWGEGGNGALGHGGTEDIGDNEQPTDLAALWLGEAVTQLAAGYYHTCALTASGAVRCWGEANQGALGYGNKQDIHNAETAGVVNVGGVTVQIAAGGSHTCALMLSGSVRCWGDGSWGALGYGNTNNVGDNEVPAAAGDIELSDAAIQIVAGDDFTCALLATGAVQCWGSGLDGRLGQGRYEVTIGDDETPASMKPILPFGI